jgi:hypothetical protein
MSVKKVAIPNAWLTVQQRVTKDFEGRGGGYRWKGFRRIYSANRSTDGAGMRQGCRDLSSIENGFNIAGEDGVFVVNSDAFL